MLRLIVPSRAHQATFSPSDEDQSEGRSTGRTEFRVAGAQLIAEGFAAGSGTWQRAVDRLLRVRIARAGEVRTRSAEIVARRDAPHTVTGIRVKSERFLRQYLLR